MAMVNEVDSHTGTVIRKVKLQDLDDAIAKHEAEIKENIAKGVKSTGT